MAKVVKKTEVELLEEEAQKGNVLAYYNLGYMHLLGENVNEDPEKAVMYFRKGASHQDGKCMQALAMCYKNGDGVETDLSKMIYWLKNGVKINDVGCMYQLACCFENGEGVHKNLEEATRLMQSAAFKNKDARKWLKQHHQKVPSLFERLLGVKMNIREAAVLIIQKVSEGGYLNLTLNSVLKENQFSRADADFLTRLVYSVMSHLLTLEYGMKDVLEGKKSKSLRNVCYLLLIVRWFILIKCQIMRLLMNLLIS